MDDFETFKASREKVDPSSRKMSENQWQQAYSAYVSTRQRVGSSKRASSSSGRRKRRSGSSVSSVTNLATSTDLRKRVRGSSAYEDLRLMVNILSWVAIGFVALSAAVKLVYYTNVSAALVSVLDAAIWIVAIVGLRLLSNVLIDIPDIALFERLEVLRDPGDEDDTDD